MKTPADRSGWDVHTHLIPSSVVGLAQEGLFGMHASQDKLHVCGHGVPLYPIGDINRLIERIDADGLEGAIVSVPPPLFRPDLSGSDVRDYCTMINEGLWDACAPHGICRPLAYLPAENPELAAELATQLDDRWAGVIMGTALGTLNYSSPRYDVLWQALSDSCLSLFIHPGSTPDTRLAPYYLGNLLGNPIETTIAASHLIFANVMQRFPKLNIILAHGGGAMAALGGRWQRGADTNRPGISADIEPPIDALRRFYVDSLVHSPAYLAALIEIIGEDRIVLGSDWPFPMGAPSAAHDIGHLDDRLRHKIRKTNAEAAFGERLLKSS